MDKQLLKALDNIGIGLEALVEALQKSGEAKSNVGETVQSGDFGKSLEQISVEIKSIKTDTQEILKNQETLIGIAKKKESEKKTEDSKDPVADAGDPKKTGALKKGLATILLIAVAVLAIGLAFKLVGKINIMSVIALGIGIVLVAVAFERVAKIKGASGGPLTMKEALTTSLIMVTMSLALLVSSKILSNISPVSIKQAITAGLIALLFVLVAPAIGKLISSLMTSQEVEYKGLRVKTQKLDMGAFMGALIMVPLLMITSSIGIMISSKILSQVVPLKITQLITITLIAVMFAVVAKGIAGLITAFTSTTEASGGGFGFKTQSIGMGKVAAMALLLPIIMLGISAGIALSSKVLQMVQPIGFRQAFTAILIAGMFAVVSIGIGKLIDSLGPYALGAIILLPFAMVAIALGIALAAKIFANYKSSFDKLSWVIMLKILLLGVAIGAITFVMSYAIKNLKNLDLKTVILLPLLLTLISLAVAASAYIFGQDKIIKSLEKINFLTIVKIALVGIAIGIISIVAAFALKIMGDISFKKVILLPILFTLISLAVAVSSFIFAKFSKSFDKLTFSTIFRIIFFGVAVAIVAIAMAFAIKIIDKLISPTDALKGGVTILILAGVIALTSLILSIGKYNKYPSIKWGLGVALSLAAFGVGALALGSAVFGPQALVFLAGLAAIMLVAVAIVGADAILSAGKYTKYPSIGWSASVALTLGAFTAGIIVLGLNALNPFFYAGFPLLKKVARSITDVSNILSKGKYNANFGQWAAGVVLLYATFTPIILILGAVAIAGKISGFLGGPDPFKEGQKMLVTVANSILAVDKILAKGTYKGGPTKKWAEGVSIGIGAFAPVYAMLMKAAVFKVFGASGVSPKDFVKAIIITSQGIVAAAAFFAKNKSVFANPPSKKWSEGVGLAIGAFAPVFKTLQEGGGWFSSGKDAVEDMIWAIKAVTRGIVASAKILSKNKAPFDVYPTKKWGYGIYSAIKTFLNIFKVIEKNGFTTQQFSWYSASIASVIGQMVYVSKILYKNRKALSYTIPPTWMKSLTKNIIGYAVLQKSLSKISGNSFAESLASIASNLLGIEDDPVAKMAKRLVKVAMIIEKGKKAFQTKVDPFFMRKVGQNLIDFSYVVQRIAEVESKTSFGGNLLGELTGRDPISSYSRKMIKLAKGYDAMANALLKLGRAIKILKLKDLKELAKITSEVSSGTYNPERRISPVVTKDLFSSKKFKVESNSGSGNYNSQFEKLISEMKTAVSVLKSIKGDSSSINKYLADVDSEPKPPEEVGGKGKKGKK